MSLNSSLMSSVATIITMLLKLVNADVVKAAMKAFLDKLEEQIKASENKFDDWALPVIAKAREILGLE